MCVCVRAETREALQRSDAGERDAAEPSARRAGEQIAHGDGRASVADARPRPDGDGAADERGGRAHQRGPVDLLPHLLR